MTTDRDYADKTWLRELQREPLTLAEKIALLALFAVLCIAVTP